MDAVDSLNALSRKIADPHLIEKAGIMAADIIRGHIYSGNGMSPLSPATTAYRGQGRPLQDTGALRDSITSEVTGDGTARIGTVVPYAAAHNNGATITAKKNWLFIPAAGTRKLERRYGRKPGDVLGGLRNEGFSVFRVGRTVCYRKKGGELKTAYYLKKSVVIPKRKFFYLSDAELDQIAAELTRELQEE